MEQTSAGPGLGAYPPGKECSREKYWHEKSAEEKCIKLGEAVEYLTRELRESRQLLEILRGHQHMENGTLVIPVNGALEGRRVEESYFYRNPLGRETP